MRALHDAGRRPARPVRPRARGVGAQRADQRRRPLGGFGVDPETGQPITDEHLDRPARAAGGGGARARHVRRLRRDPGDAQQPDRRDGPARLPRAGTGDSRRGIPIVNLPGCPVQPDNITETLLCAGAAPRATWARRSSSTSRAGPRGLFDAHGAGELQPGRVRRAGRVLPEPRRRRSCLVKLGCKGPVVKCNVPIRGWIERHRRLPERRRHLHRLHDARLPRQVHAVHGAGRRAPCSTPGTATVSRNGPVVRFLRERRHPPHVRRRARLAPAGSELDDGYRR